MIKHLMFSLTNYEALSISIIPAKANTILPVDFRNNFFLKQTENNQIEFK